MRVRFHNRFFDELNAIKEFIAKDSASRANGFVDEVFSKCLDLKICQQLIDLAKKLKRATLEI